MRLSTYAGSCHCSAIHTSEVTITCLDELLLNYVFIEIKLLMSSLLYADRLLASPYAYLASPDRL